MIPFPASHTDISTEPAPQLATGDVAMGQQPEGPPARRLKLVFKQARSSREVRPAAAAAPTVARTSRTGRVINAPTSFAPAPSDATGKRKPGSRKKEANIVCVHCGRGNSPSSNQIVFCDGCNTTWHQKCHDPSIPDDVIEVRESEWLCASCKPVPRAETKAKSTKPAVKKDGPQTMKAQKPASKAQRQQQQARGLDVGGSQFTTAEQRGYLAALSHTQLVELVVRIATENPNVPVFPANLRALPSSQFTPAPVDTTMLSASIPGSSSPGVSKKRSRTASAAPAKDQAEAEPVRPMKRSRATSAPVRPTQTTIAKAKSAATTRKTSAPVSRPSSSKSNKNSISATSRQPTMSAEPALSRASSPEESELETDDDDFDIEDHRLYPRAGNGFSPPSDPAALNILDEDPESNTFSHQLHGPAKKTNKVKAARKIV